MAEGLRRRSGAGAGKEKNDFSPELRCVGCYARHGRLEMPRHLGLPLSRDHFLQRTQKKNEMTTTPKEQRVVLTPRRSYTSRLTVSSEVTKSIGEPVGPDALTNRHRRRQRRAGARGRARATHRWTSRRGAVNDCRTYPSPLLLGLRCPDCLSQGVIAIPLVCPGSVFGGAIRQAVQLRPDNLVTKRRNSRTEGKLEIPEKTRRPGASSSLGVIGITITPDDAVGRRVFSGISRLPRPFVPALLHTHLNHPRRLSRPRFLRAGQEYLGSRVYILVDALVEDFRVLIREAEAAPRAILVTADSGAVSPLIIEIETVPGLRSGAGGDMYFARLFAACGCDAFAGFVTVYTCMMPGNCKCKCFQVVFAVYIVSDDHEVSTPCLGIALLAGLRLHSIRVIAQTTISQEKKARVHPTFKALIHQKRGSDTGDTNTRVRRPIALAADLLWRSWLVRRRPRARRALGSNPSLSFLGAGSSITDADVANSRDPDVCLFPWPSHVGEPGSILGGSFPDFRMWKSCWAICRCSVGFPGDPLFPPSLHSDAAPFSPHFTLIGFKQLERRGRGDVVVRLLTFHRGVPSSIPSGVDHGFSHAVIVSYDAAGRLAFSGISRFPRPGIRPHFTLSGSQGLDFKSLQNPFTPLRKESNA
ncbi:hypothetical protein PR048_024921 [Dryococelus australis]|uniref:Uncharacterized protein n=1 Tax=Dryococelus australis TaxID=614101 RepID=A0ABQ9GPX0_9NEOP|nr:hypothetical protein PR048_024921 [Dryococelus australis]